MTTPPPAETPPPTETPPPMGTISNWTLTLTASVPDSAADGGVNYNRLVAGEDAGATDLFDNGRDVRALLAGSLEAYFDHSADANYGSYSKQIWRDIRAPGLPKTWSLIVKAESGAEVTLRWTLPAEGATCSTSQFVLEDVDGVVGRTDMCSNGFLVYTSDGPLKHFMLKVSQRS